MRESYFKAKAPSMMNLSLLPNGSVNLSSWTIKRGEFHGGIFVGVQVALEASSTEVPHGVSR